MKADYLEGGFNMRIVLLVLVPIIFLAIALTGSHILVERFFILIVLVMLFSYLFARFGLRGLKGNLKNPGKNYLPGQAVSIEAAVENQSSLLKAFLNVQVKTYQPGQKEKITVNLPSKGNFTWHENLSYPHRGQYKLGPLVVESTDPFGLFRLRRVLDRGKDIIICPATVELPFFQAEPGPPLNKYLFNEASAFAGIREYVPGDSFNRIHWRSTAHTGKLIVKEFDIDQSEKIWVILDMHKDAKYGTGMETTEEYAITIAASIIKKYHDSGLKVGLIAQNEAYHYYPAESGYINMWRMMETLAVLKASGSTPLNRTLYRARDQLAGNSLAVIITASTSDEIADSIIGINKHGIKAAAILLEAASFGGNTSLQTTETRLSTSNIPTYVVKRGNNLSEVLNSRKIKSSGKSVKSHDIAS